MSEKTWPENFCDIGGKSFEWVFINKKDFVDFCVTEMENPTGMFQAFQKYCLHMLKIEKQNKG